VRRREFIGLIGGTAVVWPLAGRAQQQAMPVVGFVDSGPRNDLGITSFLQGLNEIGYVESRNVTVEYRWAEGHYDQLATLTTELVQHQIAVMVTIGSPAALAAKQATTMIPVVFAGVGLDPVRGGLVASFNRPGSNLTGMISFNAGLGPKQLELLHDLVPTAKVIALLINPTNSLLAETQVKEVRPAAEALGLQLPVLNATTERDLDAIFTNLAGLRAGALLIGNDPFFTNQSEQLAALAARHAVPAISAQPKFATAGGLMSYGINYSEEYYQAGIYAGRILKGAKPADLPVLQPTKFELVLNLKTAKALDLTIPDKLLATADEVIE
jgi:putative tryptophan/tyrosine transport system substrate-binding protein